MRSVLLVLLSCATAAAAPPRVPRSVSGVDACDGRDFARCVKAAERLERAQRPPLGAWVLAQHLCDNGFAAGCKTAAHIEQSLTSGDDIKQAFERWDASCAAGQASDCFALGFVIQSRGDEARKERAGELFEQACDGGEARACSRRAAQLITDDPTSPESAQARRLWARSCAAIRFGCERLAQWAMDERNPDRDPAEARRLATLECGWGHPYACRVLGWIYRDGVGGARDLPAARRWLARSCALGTGGACSDIGDLGGDGRDWYVRGCALDDAHACRTVSRLDEKAGYTDAALAGYTFRCERGDIESCYDEASCMMYRHCRRNPPRAAEVLERVCDAKHAAACVTFGWIRYSAWDGKADTGAAERAWRLACELGDGAGCQYLGFVLRGLGDEAGAIEAAQRACRLGKKEECDVTSTSGKDGGGG